MEKRRRIWVDKFQTRLLLRMVAYCVLYQLSVAVIVIGWTVFCQFSANGIRPLRWSDFVPSVIGVLCILPMLAYDVIRFSHRLVGPLVRFRRAMREIAAGDPVSLIKLRDGDMLLELRDEFNQMIQALQARGALPVKEEAGKREAVAV